MCAFKTQYKKLFQCFRKVSPQRWKHAILYFQTTRKSKKHEIILGLPKVGVIPIDPLLTTSAIMEQRYGPINVIVKFSNFTSDGFADSQILRAR